MEFLNNLHFTPETPFGLPLYPYFEKAYEAVVGSPASKFEYVPSVTPLSTVNEGMFKYIKRVVVPSSHPIMLKLH